MALQLNELFLRYRFRRLETRDLLLRSIKASGGLAAHSEGGGRAETATRGATPGEFALSAYPSFYAWIDSLYGRERDHSGLRHSKLRKERQDLAQSISDLDQTDKKEEAAVYEGLNFPGKVYYSLLFFLGAVGDFLWYVLPDRKTFGLSLGAAFGVSLFLVSLIGMAQIGVLTVGGGLLSSPLGLLALWLLGNVSIAALGGLPALGLLAFLGLFLALLCVANMKFAGMLTHVLRARLGTGEVLEEQLRRRELVRHLIKGSTGEVPAESDNELSDLPQQPAAKELVYYTGLGDRYDQALVGRARDRALAYHYGTVFGVEIGPFSVAHFFEWLENKVLSGLNWIPIAVFGRTPPAYISSPTRPITSFEAGHIKFNVFLEMVPQKTTLANYDESGVVFTFFKYLVHLFFLALSLPFIIAWQVVDGVCLAGLFVYAALTDPFQPGGGGSVDPQGTSEALLNTSPPQPSPQLFPQHQSTSALDFVLALHQTSPTETTAANSQSNLTENLSDDLGELEDLEDLDEEKCEALFQKNKLDKQ